VIKRHHDFSIGSLFLYLPHKRLLFLLWVSFCFSASTVGSFLLLQLRVRLGLQCLKLVIFKNVIKSLAKSQFDF
jgi:hypothetical protein